MDCITVSMFPFKACIEDQLQRLADALTVSLRNAVLSNFKAVDVFLEDSMEKFSRRPRTIDDIGEVHLPFTVRLMLLLLLWLLLPSPTSSLTTFPLQLSLSKCILL